jgi:hypothetical protein
MAGYFGRQAELLKTEIQQLLGPGVRRLELERLGAVDRAALTEAVHQYISGHEHHLGAYLHLTLEAERWLAWRSARK